MIEAVAVFGGENEKRRYVEECEASFEAALDLAVARVLKEARSRIVTLSGPTCSGKTTLARKLISEFSEAGRRVHVVSIDDFYYDRALLLERAAASGGPIDFDSPATIGMHTFGRAVEDILAGRPTRLPRFDFKSGRRSGYECIDPNEQDVYIFEGIQAIYPEVTSQFSGHDFFAVTVFANRGLRILGEEINRTELRLLRRLVRDYNFRGATPAFTLELWRSVRANEEEHIIPYLGSADLLLDSTLGYELSVLKPFLLPLLASIPADHDFRADADRICGILARVDEISKSYIPEISLYREFLG